MYLLHIVKIHGTVSCDLCLLGCVRGISHMQIRGLPKAMRLNRQKAMSDKCLQNSDLSSVQTTAFRAAANNNYQCRRGKNSNRSTIYIPFQKIGHHSITDTGPNERKSKDLWDYNIYLILTHHRWEHWLNISSLHSSFTSFNHTYT